MAPSPRPAPASAPRGHGFARRFLALAGGYWSGPERWKVRLLSAALLALTVCSVVVPVLINLWSQRFFDALEQRSMDRFLVMIAAIVGIIALNILTIVLHLRVKRRLQLGWRAWLTDRLLNDWVSKGHQHQVTHLPGEHDNPDGRIAEDIRIATEYAFELGLSLLYCVLLLFSFTSILWTLSGAPEITVFGHTVAVPGYLLYLALLYAGAATTIAMLIGQPLVTAANRRQRYEADFRFGLARVREHALSVALLHGEGDERRRLGALFQGVRHGWHRQTRALSHMMTFTSAYSVLSTAVPILVAAPRYIGGAITLGVLMQTAQAFQQTVAALSWPIDNLPRAAEWKASVERVLGLHDALGRLDLVAEGDDGARILVERLDTERNLCFHGVSIAEADGRPLVERFDLTVEPGERVLITGDAGAAIRLFRAVARVWTWGSGRISLPAHTRVFFMPQRPYLPHGPLRAALSYPALPETVGDTAAQAALVRVGLAHLVPRLDEADHWDEVLALPEQQRLGFARLLIRRPDWIFVEHATDSLDLADEEALLALLDEEFPGATLLTIGSHAGLAAHHRRTLVLERTGDIVRLRDEGPALVVPAA